MHVGRELFDARVGLFDIGAQLRGRREVWIAQPVMADHSLFVRVRDRACLQFPHRGKRLVHARLHFFEKIIRKTHPADVDGEIEIVVAQKIFLKPRPER